jgi:dihydrofolate synthase/folylpolyglutamate synthase
VTARTTLEDWLTHIDGRNWQTVDMGLDRIIEMLERLNIQKPAPYVITVAGTNGKGSTCYACEALLLAHGLTVGTAISPHIDRFNERIRVNGEEVADDVIVSAFEAVEVHRKTLPLTYFEYCVLASFWLFRQCNVDVAVLEIGLGGRLDGFNVVGADSAVITSIDLDHQAILGDDRETIGAEKAGIFRPGQRIILAENMPNSVIDASKVGGEVIRFEQDIKVTTQDTVWTLEFGDTHLAGLPMTSLAQRNVALACAAVTDQVSLEENSVKQALAQLNIRGRLERRQWHDRTIILDVAHNPAGVAFLFEELQQRSIEPTVICCAMLRDKDHMGVYRKIRESFSGRWLFIDSLGDRAFSGAELNKAMGSPGVTKEAQTIEHFLDSETSPADVILGLGSFSLVEQLLIGVPERA